jgi:protein gp37
VGLESRDLIPITNMLPMLQGDDYADVRESHAARMQLQEGYEAADGEYLKKIRDELQRLNGPRTPLWKEYLDACGIPYDTAKRRIWKAENHVAQPRDKDNLSLSAAPGLVTIAADDLVRLENIQNWAEKAGYYGENPDYGDRSDTEDDEDWPPPEPAIPDGRFYDDPTPVIESTLVEKEVREGMGASREHFSVAEWQASDIEEEVENITLALSGHGSLIGGETLHWRHGGFNKQDTTNIEWARWSWNPVTGCLHNCPYCYARDIANRFYPWKFEPIFHPERLAAPQYQRVPEEADYELGWRNVFTCSMADLFGKWVPSEWIQLVLDVVRDAPQWNFLFLTKFPVRLAQFEFPQNAWLGTTVDCQARVKFAEKSFAKVKGGIKWLSVEPMLEPLHFASLNVFDWVVIGGASASSQTPEWHPPRRWVDDLEAAARDAGCMIYEKTNLQARLREYPGWERQEATLPPALAYLPSIG